MNKNNYNKDRRRSERININQVYIKINNYSYDGFDLNLNGISFKTPSISHNFYKNQELFISIYSKNNGVIIQDILCTVVYILDNHIGLSFNSIPLVQINYLYEYLGITV